MSWLEPTPFEQELFEDQLLSATSLPEVMELARLVSLAPRVEPRLLRHLRLYWLPASEPEIEYRLWFSELVGAHSTQDIVFHQGVGRLLADQLQQDAQRFATVWRHTQASTRHWTALQRLERDLRYHALRKASRYVTKAVQQQHEGLFIAGVRDVLRSLKALDGDDRESALTYARWIKQVLPALISAEDKSRDELRLLAQFSAKTLGATGEWTRVSRTSPLPSWLGPTDSNPADGARLAVAVRQDPGDDPVIELTKPDTSKETLLFSSAFPALLHIQGPNLPGEWHAVSEGVRIKLPRGAETILLSTIDGTGYQLEFESLDSVTPQSAFEESAAEPTDAVSTEKETASLVGKVAIDLDRRAVPAPGLYLCVGTERFEQVQVSPPELDAGKPYLLLLPGSVSNAEDTFGILWSDASENAFMRRAQNEFSGSILAFNCWSLSRHPITNALELVAYLPEGARLSIIGHSVGGLIGELLCRTSVSGGGAPFSDEEIAWFAEAPEIRDNLLQLSSRMLEKRIVVERLIAVATPFRGSRLFERSKQLLGLLPNLAKLDLGFFTSVAVDSLLQALRSPTELPGLEAIRPESSLMRLINNPAVTVDGDLWAITGDTEASGILEKLKLLAIDKLFGEDNDLMVPTSSMTGGARRTGIARVAFFQGPDINHFSYYQNPIVVQAIDQALHNEDSSSMWQPISYLRSKQQEGGFQSALFDRK